MVNIKKHTHTHTHTHIYIHISKKKKIPVVKKRNGNCQKYQKGSK